MHTKPERIKDAPRAPSGRLFLVGFLAVAVFAILAGRFWHPYYGFTRFLQIDSSDEQVGIHEIRQLPIFIYPGFDGYDGSAYAQIAFHPLLDTPELTAAIGNVPYRARRILGSALAWALAGGRPERIANTYAELNLGLWLVFAFVLWRLLPVRDWGSWAAWAGLLFSAGVLHSVRLALTDLLGVTLLAIAMHARERAAARTLTVGPRAGIGSNRRHGSTPTRASASSARPLAGLGSEPIDRPGSLGFEATDGRSWFSLWILALGGLARETTLASIVGWWRGPWDSWRAWAGNLVKTLLVGIPLAAWMGYVRWKAGPAPQGIGNFSWPVVGFVQKWLSSFAAFHAQPDYFWLNLATLLALLGLTAQAAYLIVRPRLGDPWWRIGAVGVLMMFLFGTSVWEGNPGAATRVLLPMELAFAVLLVRDRASAAWILIGNLTIVSGILALCHVPQSAPEFTAGRADGAVYIARLGPGWYGREDNLRHFWTWTAGDGEFNFIVRPATNRLLTVRLGLRAISLRKIEIRQGRSILWEGEVGPARQFISFGGLRENGGPLRLSTPAPAEHSGGDPRGLGFAVYDLKIE